MECIMGYVLGYVLVLGRMYYGMIDQRIRQTPVHSKNPTERVLSIELV